MQELVARSDFQISESLRLRTQTFTPGIHFNYTETMLLMPEHPPQLSQAASFGRFGRPSVVAPRNAASAAGRGRKGRCHFKPESVSFRLRKCLRSGSIAE
jgi:hypothetical protein